MPVHGLIYPYELIFFYLGVIYLALRKNFASYVLLVWLILYPAANSFTGLGEISRITHVIPLLPIITGFGIYTSYLFLKKTKYFKIVLTLTVVIAVFNIFSFLINYFYVFPLTNSKNGSYAYVQLFKQLKKINPKQERVFITRDYMGQAPEYQARIFLPIDPQAFQDDKRNEYALKKPENYIDYKRIDNFYFGVDENRYKITGQDLLVVSKHELQKSDSIIFEAKEPSGEASLYAIHRISNEK